MKNSYFVSTNKTPWGFSILRPFHQYYNYIGTLKGDRGDNDKGVCNRASFMSLDA